MSEPVVLDLDKVAFTYRGAESAALSDIDLRLAPGQMHAVLGPLGSGTSTLGRLITGLLNDRGTITGAVRLDGTAIMLGDDPEAQLSGMTSLVGDEVQLAGRLHGDEPAAVEARARLALESLSIADLWGRRLDTLSGGQRQLVALAGLLTLRPSLVVLDQPSLSLDPDTRRRLGEVLQDFCSTGGAVLITAHQFDEVAEACHGVSVLQSGHLRAAVPRLSTSDCERAGIWDTRARRHRRRASVGADVSARAEPAALDVRDLSVVRAQASILTAVDLEVRFGEIVTIMGSNGAGKSTLLRSLVGLLGPHARTSGTITVADQAANLDLGEAPAHERAMHLGWVGQDPGNQLSAATVWQELMHAAPLPPHRRRERTMVRSQRQDAVVSAMVETQLTDVSATHPYDLGIDVRKDLVMASALIAGPRILLLDEPTLGRDHRAIGRLNTFIAGFLRRGGAILATTHDRQWAVETSDRLLSLGSGGLSEDTETGGAE